MAEWTLAVDIGTTSVTAAVSDGGRTEVLEFDGKWAIPPAVFFPEIGPPSAGRLAAEKALEEPGRVVLSPKQALAEADEVVVAGHDVPPAKLYAAILAEVSRSASYGREPDAPSRLILTIPAGPSGREIARVSRAAAREAGLPVPEFVTEPTAAACRLAADARPGQVVAILDAGGGSIDAAVLHRTASGFGLAGPPGTVARTTGDNPDVAVRQGVYELLATIASAGLVPSQLSAIHVTGLASRLPATASLIGEILGVTPRLAPNPATANVVGALEAGRAATDPGVAPSHGRLRDGARRGIHFATRTRARQITTASTGLVVVGAALSFAILAPAASGIPTVLYVAADNNSGNNYGGIVESVNIATGSLGRSIRLKGGTGPIAVTPNGKTAYVVSHAGSGDSAETFVVPINLAAGTAGTPIPVGGSDGDPDIAIAPDGKTAYVTDQPSFPRIGPEVMLPINIATGKAGAPIRIEADGGPLPWYAIAITPDGRMAYVTGENAGGVGTVVPVNLVTATVGGPIVVGGTGGWREGVAIAPDGKTAYVSITNAATHTASVVPITIATGEAEKQIPAGGPGSGAYWSGIAITPDGETAYIRTPNGVTPVNLAKHSHGKLIRVGGNNGDQESNGEIVITPDGKTAYIASTDPDEVVPIDLATGEPGKPVWTGNFSSADIAAG